MEIIKHRINTLQELKKLDLNIGLEVDIRSWNGNLILNHEVHFSGDSLVDICKFYAQTKRESTLIFNIKEDGLESEVLKLVRDCKINNFFFLDLSIPTTIKLCIRDCMKNVAIRVSEYETIESALKFKGLADWIWLDSFSGSPASEGIVKELKNYFKICLVSPELEGFPSKKIPEFKKLIPWVDAICTKHEKLWLTT